MDMNDTNATDMVPTAEPKCEDETTVYVQVMGTIIFFLVWPFIVVDMKWFPLGRPAAALVGGVFMVIFGVLTQSEVYMIEGTMGNLQALFLLFGMMLLSYYFDREGILRLVSLFLIGKGDKPFKYILWKVCLLSAVLAAFITNDATSLVLTPLLLGEFIKQGRPKKEILPLCLGIATSANIGSAATVFGNPQNAFIASAAGVALIDFFIALLPAAILGVITSCALLHLIYQQEIFGCCVCFRFLPESIRERFFADDDAEAAREEAVDAQLQGRYAIPAGTLAEERASIALSFDQSADPFQSSQMAKEREIMYSTEQLPTSGSMARIAKSRSRQSGFASRASSVRPSVSNPNLQVRNSQSVPEIHVDEANVENGLRKQLEAQTGGTQQQVELTQIGADQPSGVEDQEDEFVIKSIKDRTWRERIFMIWLIGISILMVVLLIIPPPPTVNSTFNLGLVPLAAGVLTMFVDSIINRKYAYDAMLRVDWTVILMFMGLFVWINGFQNTCLPDIVFDKLKSAMNLNEVGGVLFFTVFVIIGSNIFSNVPLTILIVDRIDGLCGKDPCSGPLPGLLLAWIATVAGNFTLIGSITNLIVAEKARSTADYRITFARYLKFGLVSTPVVIFGCLPIVYFLGKLA